MRPAARDRAWTVAGAAALVAVAAVAAAAAVAAGDRRPERLRAIAFASAICLAGGMSGWLVSRLRPADPGRAVATALAGIGLRIFPALAALAWLQAAGGRLRENGAGEWLLVFYLALLATDILLHMIGARRGGARAEN